VRRPLRIFVADRHDIIREGLKSLLQRRRRLTVVGEAADGSRACAAIAVARPHLAVVDAALPTLSGRALVSEIALRSPGVRILMLATEEDPSSVRELFLGGAHGCLLKRASAQDLLQAVEVVATGGTYLDPALAIGMVGHFTEANALLASNADLSRREMQVLRLVAAGHTTKEIAGRLSLSTKTVETYRTRAAEKLHLRGRADIVRYAIAHKWLDRPS
jgi:DNA-binding NarL/FixJ family response regulator